MKKYVFWVLAVLILVLGVYLLSDFSQKGARQNLPSPNENNSASTPRNDQNELPLTNAKEFTEETNEWLREKQRRREIAQKKDTPEKKAAREAAWERAASLEKARIKDIMLYGKVVDQFGDPVPGVQVEYYAVNAYLATGTGHGRTITDEEGRFSTEGVKGIAIVINGFAKPGYQFAGMHRFANRQTQIDSLSWRNYTKEEPYVFKAWKVERYPEVAREEEAGFLFTPDGRTSTVDLLTNEKQRFKKGIQDGDFTISFNRIDDDWSVRLEALNGGFQETNDIFLNMAPEDGYQEFAEYKFLNNHANRAKKKYYIKIRDGKYYGQMSLEYRAYEYRNGKGAVFLSYVVNLEGARDLVVKK